MSPADAPLGAATARAFPNIALVKYWGKRDEELILPAAGSLSLTLDALPTTTTVEVGAGSGQDVLILNGEPASASATARTSRFLDVVRDLAGDRRAAVVTSRNAAPTGAGMASSASGFAALALAAATAYGLDLDRPALSRLARRGSGSACRSVVPGLAIWHAGDDLGSFAEPVPGPDLRLVPVIVSRRPKAVSSRRAMRRSRDTSPFYPRLGELHRADPGSDARRPGRRGRPAGGRTHRVPCAANARGDRLLYTACAISVAGEPGGLRRRAAASRRRCRRLGDRRCRAECVRPHHSRRRRGGGRGHEGSGPGRAGPVRSGLCKEAVRIMGPGPGVQLVSGTSGTRDER
ncbi:MAG: diphosphomevalonate decarboxylase [Acidipropionibacterium sp.]|nr:diphosphomevalonate decarboxylase [Acidipropionibacterium sp.]